MEHAAQRDITHTYEEADQPVRTEPGEGLSISADSLVWLAVLVAGAAIRFAGLDDNVLTLVESRRAIDALQVAAGDMPETWMGDAAAAATSYLFEAFGGSVSLARLPSAFGGTALLLALWLMRPHIGRTGALAAGVLIAFSPLFVFFSRSAEPFGIGAAVAVMAAVSLLSYLRDPGPGWLFSFALFAGLATLTDAVAVTGVLAIAAFVGYEALGTGSAGVQQAWRNFRGSPLQWAVVGLVLAATLQLGLTHFGTTTDNIGFPGLVQFGEMFEAPRDSRPWDYHPTLLLAYDWPIVLAGFGGLTAVVLRAVRSGAAALLPAERLLVVWVALAAVVLAFATRREAGQTLVLLLPLALLGGSLASSLVREVRRPEARKWWPLAIALFLLAFGAALLMTLWASGNASEFEQALIIVFSVAAIATGIGAVAVSRQAFPAIVVTFAVLGLAFSAHSSLAVAFERGAELAREEALLDQRQERFKQTLDTLAREREGQVFIDPALQAELRWLLRDSPYVFGDELEEASVFVGLPNEEPMGFTAVADEFLITDDWYPDDAFKPRSMWRWLLYREPYGLVETTSVQIYVPTV